MIPLFTVADVFQIARRGCVLVPGVAEGGPVVRMGDAIRLRTPDGRVIDTEVRGLEMISYLSVPKAITIPILLPSSLRKEDVPIGTEVFLVSGSARETSQER